MIQAFKTLTMTVLLAVLVLAAGCQALTGETLGQNIDDTNVTAAVKAKLAADKAVSLTRVGVDTNKGIVVLTGTVESAEQRARVEDLTSQVGGVKRVINNLQVQK